MNLYKIFRIFKQLFSIKWVIIFSVCFIFFIFPYAVYKYMNSFASPYMFNKLKQVPRSHTALVLGAQVYKNNRISHVLYDRVVCSIELYKSGCVHKVLASGDHGQKAYDEVNTMKNYLLRFGVKERDLFLDHAGFDTFDSVVRAKEVFKAKDVIIVTQRFHLPRAIYIARKQGLNAYGYIADRRVYKSMKAYKIREMYARVKAFLEITFGSSPKFLGREIPVEGDGRKSWD